MENNNNKILKPNLFPETVPPPLSPPLSPPPSQPSPVIWCLHGRCFRGLGAACGALGVGVVEGVTLHGSPGLSPLGLHFAAFGTIPGDPIAANSHLRRAIWVSPFRGRCGRLNEVLDAGSRMPGLRLQQPESSSRGFLSCSLTHSFFRAAGGGGFRKSLGRTGSDPVDTCPGSTAAGLGFDSWGGGAPGDVSCPAFSWAERLEAPAALLPSPSAQLLLFLKRS